MDSLTAREKAFDEFTVANDADALFSAAKGGIRDAVSLARTAFNAGWESGVRHERFELLTYGEMLDRLDKI
jgi:hypothetical protein